MCVEPTQLPQEGVLAARVLSQVLQPADKTGEPQMTSRAACTCQLPNSCRRGLVHVMLVNFSQEMIVLPKATIVGVAEELSACVVAAIDDNDSLGGKISIGQSTRLQRLSIPSTWIAR